MIHRHHVRHRLHLQRPAGSNKNAFKITSDGTITKIIDASGDGSHGLDQLSGIAVDGGERLSSHGTDNAFKITPGGVITRSSMPAATAAMSWTAPKYRRDGTGNVYVAEP